jgi:hypothetical protein
MSSDGFALKVVDGPDRGRYLRYVGGAWGPDWLPMPGLDKATLFPTEERAWKQLREYCGSPSKEGWKLVKVQEIRSRREV